MLLLALTAIVFTWCVLASLLVGIGLLMPAAARAGVTVADRLLVAFVLGFAGVIAFLQCWHWWRPVDASALTMVAIAGAAGIAARWNTIRSAMLMVRANRGAWLAFMLLAIWTANRAMGPADAWDAGTYQLPAIRWMNAYPIVPGLGNLEWHLALNNAGLLFAAMLNAPGTPWDGRASHVASGLLIIALFALAVSCATRLARPSTSRPAAADLYGTVLVIPAVMLAMGKEVSAPRTDLAPAVVLFFAGWRFIAACETADADARRRDWIFVFVAAVLSVCLKLSAVFVAAALLTVGTAAWLRWERPFTRRTARAAGVAALLSLSLAGPWVARNGVLSGYPFFPSSVLGRSVDWRMPAAVVDRAAAEIAAWPREGLVNFAESTSGTLIPLWLQRAIGSRDASGYFEPNVWWLSLVVSGPVQILAPACLIVALTVAVCVRWIRGVGRLSPLILSVLPGAIGVAGWLIFAPEPRFGYAAWWMLAATMMAVAAARPLSRRLRVAIVISCGVAAGPSILYRAALNYGVYGTEPFSSVPFYPTGPDHGLHPLPQSTYRSFTLPSGLTLFEPVESYGLPWDGPLLAVSQGTPVGDIRLRSTTGDLAQGFASR